MDAPESPLATLGRSLGEHGPWRRLVADDAAWLRIGDRLVTGEISLLGLWGASGSVYAALFDGRAAALVSLDCPDGRFPSLARAHAPAQRPERAIRDLVGLEPEGTPDPRPWLDHGRWGTVAPLADERVAAPDAGEPDAAAAGGDPPASGGSSYPFLAAEGEGLHQIPVGPVHAGIIEPGHFRFTVNGETVVRLEQRLGYVHKGIEALMRGADLERAAQLAGRTSGDSTVAYAFAFARAAEGALGVEAPLRAQWLRALMAELERLANHLGDIGAVCNDAAFALMHTHTGILRERVLRAAEACFGHRLMRDRVVPGGVACDLDDAGRRTLAALVAEIRRRFPALVELYDNTASLQDRTVGAGVLTQALAREYAAGGFVGRASGRHFDARRALPYPPYDELRFEVPVLTQGDVDARVRIRIAEVEQSLEIVEQILDLLPAGELRAALPRPRDGGAREGVAMVEGFRGDVLVWMELAGGAIRRCHLRDPSWFQWPLLEAAIEGNIVADFPLCNKSFNCSYSGHDL